MIKMLEKIRRINKNVIGMNERNLELIYPNNPRKYYKYADDKYLAKAILEKANIPCPKTYRVVNSMGQIEHAWQSVKEHQTLVIKPAKGAGGKGIMILRQRKGRWFNQGKPISQDEIFLHIANVIFGIYSFGDGDVALIEEFVKPHPIFRNIFPGGVPDIRIILLKSLPLMGMLRLPTNESGGKANLHQGGLGVGIDMETGILQDVYDGQHYGTQHPDTGEIIKGTQLPDWQTLIQLSIDASAQFPLEYLGVDLVIDAVKGPMIMELNVRPGLAIQLANRQGLKSIISAKSKITKA